MKIQSSVISDLTKLLKTVSDFIFKGVDMLTTMGYETIDAKEHKDGSYEIKHKSNDGTIVIEKGKPIEWDDNGKATVYNIVLINKSNNKSAKLNNISQDLFKDKAKFEKTFGDALNKIGAGQFIMDSKKLQVTLKKVTSGTEATIELTAINANYAPDAALSDLDAILSDDEFAAQITEEPVSYEITDEGESFDIEAIASVDTASAAISVYKTAFALEQNLRYVYFVCSGSEVENVRHSIDRVRWMISSMVDTTAGWIIEKDGTIPSPLECMQESGSVIDCSLPNDAQAILRQIQSAVWNMIAILDLNLVNFDTDMQGMINCWLRDCKDLADHVIKQYLDGGTLPKDEVVAVPTLLP